MELTPASSQFRMITGASIAYGLTEGGYNAPEISLTPLAKRILSPLEDGEDYAAKIEAFLRPRVISEFLKRYDGSQWPREDIAANVLTEMGVPRERCSEVRDLIFDDANNLGLVSEIKGKKFINVSAHPGPKVPAYQPNTSKEEALEEEFQANTEREPQKIVDLASVDHKARMRRVFITHGKNKEFVEPIKKLLAFGEMESQSIGSLYHSLFQIR